VDADALPTIEKPSPAAPTAVNAAALLPRLGVEAFLTMVAYSKVVVKARDVASVRPANPTRNSC
jgi:hypothetical protein